MSGYAPISPEMQKFIDEAKQVEWVGEITPLEVSQHQTPEDLWVIMHGDVYNVTQFLKHHPTGDSCFVNAQCHDITGGYGRAHPYVDPKIIEKCKIGRLVVSH